MGVQGFAIPYQGNWEHVYIPASQFLPVNSPDPDPAKPVAWQNQFGAVYFWEMQGLKYEHPTGTHTTAQAADYDLLGPPQIEQEIRGNIRDIAMSLVWWCSGDSSAFQVCWEASVGVVANGGALNGALQRVLWGSGGGAFSAIVCPAQIVTAPQGHFPECLYHLRIARVVSGGGFTDTWLYEAFLIAVVLHLRLN